MFTIAVVPKYNSYYSKYQENKELYERMDYALETILPEEASVTCSTMLLAHISDRDVIYEVNYHKENNLYKTDTEFVVLDIRSGYSKASLEIADFYRSKGYEDYYCDEGAVLILIDNNFNQ